MIRGPQVILRTGLLSGAGMEVMELSQKRNWLENARDVVFME